MPDFLRFDRLGVIHADAKPGSDGMLRLPARIARVGVQEYGLPSGGIQRELRPPDEVFHPDALASFAQVIVTLDHPPPGKVTAENSKIYARGATGEVVKKDGDHVAAQLLISDKIAVDAVVSGTHVELSGGYTCDLDFTPGEYNGIRYDAVQRNIRGNHVALVPKGRAGPSVRLRLDSAGADGILRPDPAESASGNKPAERPMPRIRLDGADHEVPDALLAPIQREIAAAKADGEAQAKPKLTALEAARDAEKARADKAEADLAAAKTDAAGKVAPDAAIAAYKARTELEAVGVKITGEKADAWAGKPDRVIHGAVLNKLLPDLKLDAKDDGYVAAAFDTAVAAQHVDHAGDARRGAVLTPEQKPSEQKNDNGQIRKDSATLDAERQEALLGLAVDQNGAWINDDTAKATIFEPAGEPKAVAPSFVKRVDGRVGW